MTGTEPAGGGRRRGRVEAQEDTLTVRSSEGFENAERETTGPVATATYPGR